MADVRCVSPRSHDGTWTQGHSDRFMIACLRASVRSLSFLSFRHSQRSLLPLLCVTHSAIPTVTPFSFTCFFFSSCLLRSFFFCVCLFSIILPFFPFIFASLLWFFLFLFPTIVGVSQGPWHCSVSKFHTACFDTHTVVVTSRCGMVCFACVSAQQSTPTGCCCLYEVAREDVSCTNASSCCKLR